MVGEGGEVVGEGGEVVGEVIGEGDDWRGR